MSEVEYNALLFDISGKLDELNELPKLIFMCRGKIAEDKEARIQNVLMLFTELERKRNLGIDKFEVLKTVLEQMKRKGKTLLKKVEDFEKKRKVMSVGIIPSLKQATGKIVGAVRMVCNFQTIAGCVVGFGTLMVLRSCSSVDEFTEAFNKVVLPAATKLIEISKGSVCFTIQAESLSALKALWDSYKDGTLKQRLQEFLVTEEIKRLGDGQEVEVIVDIDEQEYREACLDLVILETEGIDQEGQPCMTCRRNSDSTLYLKAMETEVKSISLKQAENKLNFERQRRQILEKENENLLAKLLKTSSTVTTDVSVEQTVESSKAVNLKTVIRVGAAAVVGVTVYNVCSRTPPEFFDEFSTRALPHGNTLIEMSNGCLCFTVQSEDLTALKALWDSYQEGTLKKHLQEFLVTEKIKQLANSEEVEVDVTIDEQEYKDACLDLMAAKVQASNIDEEERRMDNYRRKSDSSVNLIPKENELMLMALRQTDSKLNFEQKRSQMMEKEIESLSSKLLEAKQSTDTKHLQITEHQAEDMELERLAYVQRHLEKLQDTHSVTSETTDSGLRTHSAPSVLSTEEDSDISNEPRLRDLTHGVIKELSQRLKNDEEAWRNVCVALKLTGLGREPVTLEKVTSFFPETPVRLLKDVFDALELYDLVELLEKVKVNRSSLQVQRTLQEVRTLRKSDERPTTYHSNVAVMIIYHPTVDHAKNVERIRAFFMDLNSDNDVTNIPGWQQMERERIKEKLNDLLEPRDIMLISGAEHRELRMELESKLNETEITERVALETMDRWLQNQDKFTFWAVLDFAGGLLEHRFMMEKLATMSYKAKLILTCDDWTTYQYFPETLLASFPHYQRLDFKPDAFGKIFKKRWQTMDLCSMMEELRRTVPKEASERMQIIDNMSCKVKFKKLEDKDSA